MAGCLMPIATACEKLRDVCYNASMPNERDNASENPYEAPIHQERPTQGTCRRSIAVSISKHVPWLAGLYLLLMTICFMTYVATIVTSGNRHPIAIVVALIAITCGPVLVLVSVMMMKEAREAASRQDSAKR